MALKAKTSSDTRWSDRITKESKALPFRSAMSMLVFYINRAGRNLDKD